MSRNWHASLSEEGDSKCPADLETCEKYQRSNLLRFLLGQQSNSNDSDLGQSIAATLAATA